jgi:hydroxymethylpyrimidine/phosphomethylpyrimidine kinase
MTATTALTAQNTLGVKDVHRTPPEFLKKQIDAVCEDIGVDIVKTGTHYSVVSLSDELIIGRYAGICGHN